MFLHSSWQLRWYHSVSRDVNEETRCCPAKRVRARSDWESSILTQFRDTDIDEATRLRPAKRLRARSERVLSLKIVREIDGETRSCSAKQFGRSDSDSLMNSQTFPNPEIRENTRSHPADEETNLLSALVFISVWRSTEFSCLFSKPVLKKISHEDMSAFVVFPISGFVDRKSTGFKRARGFKPRF